MTTAAEPTTGVPDESEPGDRPARPKEPRRGILIVLVPTGILAAGLFWLVHASIIDDAYITLSYARNLAFHGHWGLIPQATSNTATSPLNVLLLAGLTAIMRHPVWAMGVLFVASGVGLGHAMLRTARALALPAGTALATTAVVLANPLLLSAAGLEVAVEAAVLGLLLMAAVCGWPMWFGVFAGLAVLTRVDLAIVVLILFAGTRVLWRPCWKAALAAAAVAVPWFAFSWVVLGSFVPDTLIIKTQQHSWGGYQFGNGPALFARYYPEATVLAFAPAALGVLALLVWLGFRSTGAPGARRLHVPAFLGLAGIAHYLAYSGLGVPPYHWYYAPALICLSLFGILAVTALPQRGIRTATTAVVLLAVLAVPAGFDVRHGLPWPQAAIDTNWASATQYAAAGHQLGQLVGDHAVSVQGEIGSLAYFCDCAVIDDFSDRTQVSTAIDQLEQHAGPLTRWLLDVNFRFLDRNLTPPHIDFALTYTTRRPPGGWYWPAASPWAGPGAPGPGYYVLSPAP